MFTLVLNAARSTGCIKKIIFNFLQKTYWAHVFIFLPGMELRGTKDLPFLKCNALEWEYQIFGAP